MPPYRSNRPLSEMDATLGDEISVSTGRNLAVTLLATEDGGTEVIVHDRDQAGMRVDIPAEVIEPLVAAHRRPGRPISLPVAAPANLPTFAAQGPSTNVPSGTGPMIGRPDTARP